MAKEIRRKTKRKIVAEVKNCFFCTEKKTPDFMNSELLSRFISDRGKIASRVRTGVCAKHQRKLSDEIKRARYIALLPFVVRPE